VKRVEREDGATLTVRVTAACAQPNPNEIDLIVRIDPDGDILEIPCIPVGNDTYQAQMPENVPCTDSIAYYVRAGAMGGGVTLDPPGAPDATYSATVVTDIVTVLDDDFETDLGWTVGDPADTADEGVWVRGDPIGTIAQPENDHSPIPGTICWFTGQGPLGGGANLEDVDGGRTTLKSPVFDLSAGTGEIRYWRWFSNDRGDGANEDPFIVDISNDGGDTWHNVETLGPIGLETSGGWFLHQFTVGDFVTPTDEMMLRFVALDEGKPSLVEAAVDDVLIQTADCESCDDAVLNQGEELIDCGGPCPPCQCHTDKDCDDQQFCNGAESCDEFGLCHDAAQGPCTGLFCVEADDACVECLSNVHCDDGLFCTGQETCNESGDCQSGSPPCAGQFCSESQNKCHECRFTFDCPDDEFCRILDGCVLGSCDYHNRFFGDLNEDGTVDLLDILCVLDGFQSVFDNCSFADDDIVGESGACGPDDVIDLFDILAVLDAFEGSAECCQDP